jgi:SAM-dependent methyltransferase
MNSDPDYSIHEDRYRDRRSKLDIYSGWFTERDYESGVVELKELLDTGHAPKTGRLLDLGCGAGNYSIFLSQMGYEVTGIDISETAISWAHENAASADVSPSFVCGDGVNLADIEDNSFDFAFDGHFLHCIIGRDRETLLENVHRVLRPGGFFLVRSIVWPVDSGGGLVVDTETKLGYLGGVPYRAYPNAEDLAKEIESSEFSVLDWSYNVTTNEGYGFQHAIYQCVST